MLANIIWRHVRPARMGKEPATWGPKLSKGPGIIWGYLYKTCERPGNSSTLTYFNRCRFVRKEHPDSPKFSLTHPKNQQRTVPPVAKNHRSQSRLSPPAGHSAWTRPRSHPISVGKYWKMLLTTTTTTTTIIIIIIIIIRVNSNISLT